MAVKVREILNEYEIEEILTEYLGAFDSMLQIIDTDDGEKVRLVLDAKSLMGVLSVAIDAPAYVEILTDDEKVLESFNNDMKLWEV